jgi:hypothetical protein
MTSAYISFSIVVTLSLVSCGEMTSPRMTDRPSAQRQERSDATSVVAPAARDVDAKGGVNQQP